MVKRAPPASRAKGDLSLNNPDSQRNRVCASPRISEHGIERVDVPVDVGEREDLHDEIISQSFAGGVRTVRSCPNRHKVETPVTTSRTRSPPSSA
jgi:hypothetical protein